jgi:hypothetical protein
LGPFGTLHSWGADATEAADTGGPSG